jgi:peroxiredoxin (alkyl hydroperoxide reductase subunit C)
MTRTSTTTGSPTGLAIGQTAPDFTLKDQNGKRVSLSDYRGIKNVVVVFYPFAFSGICTGELCDIRDNLGDFDNDDVQVLAISCDHMFTQRAWSNAEGYFFPMLSDYWPHGATAQAYGVFELSGGFSTRGTFLIDHDGVVRWTLVNGPSEKRDFAGYRAALKELTALSGPVA